MTNRSLVFLAVIGCLLKFIIIVSSPLSATIPEAQLFYFANSIGTVNDAPFWEFGKEQGYTLFIIPAFFLKGIFLFLPFNLITARLLTTLLSIISSSVFALIVISLLNPTVKLKNILFAFAFLMFLFSPWQNLIGTLHFAESLTLFSALLLVLFSVKSKTNPIVTPVLLLILALTTWPGFIFSGFLLITAFLKKTVSVAINIDRQKVILLLTILLIFLALNRNFVTASLRSSFLSKVSPSALGTEIDDRQRIDFLSVNQKFLLPAVIRKVIYNKPAIAMNKILSHIVEFFDFEMLAFPLSSYELLRLSGLSPQGNLPLVWIWEIPLIIIGVFVVAGRKFAVRSRKRNIYFLTVIGFIPALFFEKKFFALTGFIALPSLVFLEIATIYTMLKNKLLLKLPIAVVFLLLTGFVSLAAISHYRMFFYQELRYQSPHAFIFKKVAETIKETPRYKTIVATTRLGPTHLMSAFYLGWKPSQFWPVYLNKSEEKIINNVVFRPIQFPEEKPEEGKVYIGLIGEFVEPGRDLEKHDLPIGLKLIKDIPVPEETVFEYGRRLWVESLGN